jgi:ATP-dependent exoDNAse (exonuclease V) beta subunit
MNTPELLREHREADHVLGQSDGVPALDSFDSATIGSIVHKLCELEPERSDWPAIIRRLIDEPNALSEDAIDEIVRQTEYGLEAVTQLEAEYDIHSRHSELSVTLYLDAATIVGDIDHLSVADKGYIITDFKTSTVDEGTIADLTEHYYLQLLAYAGALLQSDAQAGEVRIAVAFTDARVIRYRTFSKCDIRELSEWANKILEKDGIFGDG